MQTLACEDVQALLRSTEGHHLQPLWLLLVTTGLRLGEATGLTWANVNLEAGTLAVRQALQRQRGKGFQFVEPKTGRSRRTVHLAPRVVTTLRQHRTRQKETYLRNGVPWSEKALVFSTRTARPLEPRNVRHSLRQALSNAGLPLVRVHDLRHTAASYLLSIGTHPKIVQELLGHSSVLLTLDTYSHVLPALHREVAAQMDKLIGEHEDDGDGGEVEPLTVRRGSK
jgi:integrase